MLYKQRIFKEERQKFFFENQSIPIGDMMSIPVPDFPRFREKGRHMELLHRFWLSTEKAPLPSVIKSNIIII